MTYTVFKLGIGVVATVGLYSMLYRENKFYRFWEHVFLGLAAGYFMVSVWAETLKETWYDKVVGKVAEEAGGKPELGYWPWVLLLPIGLMGYFVFSKKHNWMSRIPIGVILGLWSGQQVQVWFTRYGPQIFDSMRPLVPTAPIEEGFFRPNTVGLPPEEVARITSQIYVSQAINNLIFIVTLLCALSYFIFSYEIKTRVFQKMNTIGRWLLMIGFGAIFGSTVTMRFSLLIDRMYFVFIEFFKQGVLGG